MVGGVNGFGVEVTFPAAVLLVFVVVVLMVVALAGVIIDASVDVLVVLNDPPGLTIEPIELINPGVTTELARVVVFGIDTLELAGSALMIFNALVTAVCSVVVKVVVLVNWAAVWPAIWFAICCMIFI